jgi:hypothetical protein
VEKRKIRTTGTVKQKGEAESDGVSEGDGEVSVLLTQGSYQMIREESLALSNV